MKIKLFGVKDFNINYNGRYYYWSHYGVYTAHYNRDKTIVSLNCDNEEKCVIPINVFNEKLLPYFKIINTEEI